MHASTFVVGLLVALGLASSPAHAADLDPQGVAFFEAKIRPILVEHCYKCHSSEAEKGRKLKGGLLLDTRAGLLQGGDSGPAIVPSKPAESLLLKTMHYDGDVKMPPRGKLSAAILGDFEKWIAMGAPDPRAASSGTKRQVGLSIEAGRRFWSFRPVLSPPIPNVRDGAWPKGDIDRFILAALEARKVRPAPEAARASLIRRLSFDLTGLPPTPEEIDAFVADRDPSAYENLVDRLLASPRFGERWGRHWLDIVRYAESVTLRGFIFKEAWRYRDYVLDAFNNDMPYDQFVREQIAGDLLPAATLEDRRRQQIATTFLVLGNTNLEEQDKKQLRMDVVDEQLDVIGKGILAQTLTCARCHDHKFDPIPTRDYYALAGVLRNSKALEHANVSQWIEMPLALDPAEETLVRQHETAVAALETRIKAEKSAKGKPTSATGILALTNISGIVIDDTQARKVGAWQTSQFSGSYIGAGYLHDQDRDKGEKTLTFQPDALPAGRYDVRLAYVPGNNRSDAVPVSILSADGDTTLTVDMKKTPPIDGRFVSLGEFRFEKNVGHVLLSNEGTKGHVVADAVVFLPLQRAESSGSSSGKAENAALASLEAELKKLQAKGPKRQKVMTVVEEKTIEDTRIHVRGSVHAQGEMVPRGFLQVAMTGAMPTLPKTESGRRQLADWLTSRDNPLTARVFVNRAWHWIYGAGLVRTTDNFGTTGESPSHPELLDHLATTFMSDGWSIKKLVRRLVLSRTYRQSGAPETTTDPENRLFGYTARRRLEAECLADTMLSVSGRLSTERGGPSFPATLAADYGHKTDLPRRMVYLPMFRNSPPEILEVFDGADPSLVTGQRNASTVAPQALYLMNHPFPAEQARHAARRLIAEEKDTEKRLMLAYRRTLGREPTDGERQIILRAVERHPAEQAWTEVFHALFASADFRYLP